MTTQPEPPTEAELSQLQRGKADLDAPAQLNPARRSDTDRVREQVGSGITIPIMFTAETLSRLTPLVSSGLAAIDESDLPGAVKPELVSWFVDSLMQDCERLHAQLLMRIRELSHHHCE